MVEIRAVTADDWRLWRRARLAALAGAPDAYHTRLADWQGPGDREQRWRERLSIPGALDLIAVRSGEPVGIASGVPEPEGTAATIISMWVDHAARGSGVGDRLLGTLENWALDRGYSTLRLEVFAGNEHAIGLYRRNGFEFQSRTAESTESYADPTPDGRVERIMVKVLLPTG